MSLQAYKTVAQRGESPRELEYRLFGEVTRALITASELAPTDFAARMPALDLNRRMWGALASDCAHDGNALPPQLRANIISLALWVGRHTSAVMRREEEFGPLIEINRILMQGLAPAGTAAAANAA